MKNIQITKEYIKTYKLFLLLYFLHLMAITSVYLLVCTYVHNITFLAILGVFLTIINFLILVFQNKIIIKINKWRKYAKKNKNKIKK